MSRTKRRRRKKRKQGATAPPFQAPAAHLGIAVGAHRVVVIKDGEFVRRSGRPGD